MKFTFIAAIHFMELEDKDMLITLPCGNISNNKHILDKLFHNNLSLHTLGIHSIDEIYDAPSYYYVNGDLSTYTNQNEVDAFGTTLCFAFLRQIQGFVNELWNICDNSIYVRDGFLYTYTNDISDGCTFKASVSLINTFSTGEIKNVVISRSNLLKYGSEMNPIVNKHEIEVLEGKDLKLASQFQHFKKYGLSRKELAEYYVAVAHGTASIPMKILMYCSALEALVSNSTTELSHRVAERVAVLLGINKEERIEIYSNVKFGYDIRSKVAHGDYLKKEEGKIRECSSVLDECIRNILKLDDPFAIKCTEIDSYYLNKLFE